MLFTLEAAPRDPSYPAYNPSLPDFYFFLPHPSSSITHPTLGQQTTSAKSLRTGSDILTHTQTSPPSNISHASQGFNREQSYSSSNLNHTNTDASQKPNALTGAGVTKSAKKEVTTKKEPGTPATPTNELQNVALETPTKTKPRVRPAQKKTKSNISPEKAFNALRSILDSDGSNLGDAAPIDVSYENATPSATPTIHSGAYGQQIRLHAPQPFSVVQSVRLTWIDPLILTIS